MTALDAADERWHTIGWGIDRVEAGSVAISAPPERR
ncbi:hypothetical protein H4W80_003618 [Nonomuraea angiospora]|uniref:Uncharacterized protein n=1 Tax=Nonomuraea angiospora TaxID=46172 RepID=A0ABR9LYC8_9ACTN|nr:hypothetical protein [Nonomuraea angiospora]